MWPNIEGHCSWQLNLNTVLSGPPLLSRKLKFRVLWAIVFHMKVGSGNEHSRTTAPTQSGAGSQQGSGIRNKQLSKTTTPTGRDWSQKDNPGGAKEKPHKTTSSMQRECPYMYWHRWLTLGAAYMAAKTIRQASSAGGGSLRSNRLLCWHAEAARQQPSKTILGPKAAASKHEKQEPNSHVRETEGVCT